MTTASWRTYQGYDGMRPPKSVHWWASCSFATFFNMAAVRYFKFEFCHFDHPRSELCDSISLSKFGVDPIFAVRDITILRFCQFGWKMPNHARFWGFWEAWTLKIAVRHPYHQKTSYWVSTRHLSHKRLKSVYECDLNTVARKKV